MVPRESRVAEVLPLLYLHGLSTGDFVPALEQFLGSAAGLSSATITRLTKQWTDDYHAFSKRDLSSVDYVYVWVDGIHVNVRLEEDKLCLLVWNLLATSMILYVVPLKAAARSEPEPGLRLASVNSPSQA